MNVYEALTPDPDQRRSLWRLAEALTGTNTLLEICEFDTPGDPSATGQAVWIGVRGQRRWRHRKRGTTYGEMARGQLQSARPVHEGDTLVSYVGEDGRHWFRPTDEFDDGRFEACPG